MAIKPSPTIAGKLRKLFSNNKQTIEPAIDDTLPGGSGGGANVLTLYLGIKGPIGDAVGWAYKNQELTEEYETYEEAYSALNNADVIIIIPPVGSPFFKDFGLTCGANIPGDDSGFVSVRGVNGSEAFLWKETIGGEGEGDK